MRSCVVLAMAMTGLAPVASAEPLWTVEAAAIAYLVYGEPGKPVLSISCGQEDGDTGRDETRIEVEVEKGNKPGKDKVVLRVDEDKGHQDVPLTPLVCGGLSECKTQPGGEVYRYQTSVPGKTSRSTSLARRRCCRSMRPAPSSPRRRTRPPSRNSP